MQRRKSLSAGSSSGGVDNKPSTWHQTPRNVGLDHATFAKIAAYRRDVEGALAKVRLPAGAAGDTLAIRRVENSTDSTRFVLGPRSLALEDRVRAAIAQELSVPYSVQRERVALPPDEHLHRLPMAVVTLPQETLVVVRHALPSLPRPPWVTALLYVLGLTAVVVLTLCLWWLLGLITSAPYYHASQGRRRT